MNDVATKFEELSDRHKREIIDLTFVYPNTSSIKSDIDNAIKFGVKLEYDCNNGLCNFSKTINELRNNPKFKQMGSNELLIDIIQNVEKNQENVNIKNLDYIYFQRTKIPVLVLENKSNSDIKQYIGVSSFLELNDFRSRVFSKYDFQEKLKGYNRDDYSRIIGIGIGVLIPIASGVICSSLTNIFKIYSNNTK